MSVKCDHECNVPSPVSGTRNKQQLRLRGQFFFFLEAEILQKIFVEFGCEETSKQCFSSGVFTGVFVFSEVPLLFNPDIIPVYLLQQIVLRRRLEFRNKLYSQIMPQNVHYQCLTGKTKQRRAMIPLEKAKLDFEDILICPLFLFLPGKGKAKIKWLCIWFFCALQELQRASSLPSWSALWFLFSITGSGSRRECMEKINPPICIK